MVVDGMSIAAEYERLCATPSDIWLHLPRLVALVDELLDKNRKKAAA